VGLHRYRFKPGIEAHVVLDLRSSIYDWNGKNLWSRLRLRGQDTLTGMRETRGWAPGRQLYFAIRFSQPAAGAPADEPRGRRRVQGLRSPGKNPPRRCWSRARRSKRRSASASWATRRCW
jgi:hypothetical protein